MKQGKSLARKRSILASPLLLMGLSSLGIAQDNCPTSRWEGSIPSCPSGDNTILPANFPNAAYVVSDDQRGKAEAAQEFTPSVVLEILKNSGDRLPLIIMPVSAASFQRVQHQIRDFVAKHPEYPHRDQWLSTLVQSYTSEYTWQQDYFESFFDPSTGKPILRGIQAYDLKPAQADSNTINVLSNSANKSCSRFGRVGPKLAMLGVVSNEAAYYGGNIEGLPGGLCLHGDNQPREFSAQYCGSPANETIISTSWLHVGHVDEVSGVIKNPNANPPCDFAITIASPSLAIQLLKSKPQEKFYSFQATGDHASTDLSYRATSTNGGLACTLVRELLAKQSTRNQTAPAPDDPQRQNGSDRSGKAAWLLHFINPAYAGVVESEPGSTSGFDCTKITNAQVVEALESIDRARINNKLIQLKMDEAKKTIAAKIGERLPQCQIKFIEIPQIFDGKEPVENRDAKSGDPLENQYSLRDRSMNSILPNGTNALVVGNSILSPHPQNAAFAQYMDKAYATAGIKNVSIDTYDYAHTLYGNLHCSTHSIPICKPVAAARRSAQ